METQSDVTTEVVECVTVEGDHDYLYSSSHPVEPMAYLILTNDSAKEEDTTQFFLQVNANQIVEVKEGDLATDSDLIEKTDSSPNVQQAHSDEDEEKKHRCDVCGKCYQTAKNLRRHIAVQHSEERPFSCHFCSRTFKINGFLQEHLRFHTGITGFDCVFCGKNFHKSHICKRHELTHILKAIENECLTCKRRFPSEKALNKHKETDKCETPKYTCCEKTFLKKKDYLMHRLELHPEQRVREHRCKVCDQSFLFAYKLTEHEKTHKPIRQVRFFDKSRPKMPKPTGIFQCKVCREPYRTLKELVKHSREEHADEKPFVCSKCGKGLTTKVAFDNHLRFHTDERPYRCSYCDKGFKLNLTKKAHERIHTGERPFQCRYCDKKFARYQTLLSHELTHTGEKPYVCKVCNRGFAQASTLKGHLRTHDNGSTSPKRKKTKVMGISPAEDRAREVRRLLMGTQEIRKAQEQSKKTQATIVSQETLKALSAITQQENHQAVIEAQQYQFEDMVVVLQ